jgi:putative phosphoribosyl transferase
VIRAVTDLSHEIREPFWASANLCLPRTAVALVVLAYNEADGQREHLRRKIAEYLAGHRIACCAVSLTNEDEHVADRMILDIETLADRFRGVVEFMSQFEDTRGLPIGIFGEDYCAAAAMMVATDGLEIVKAVGAYCGRPDLARLSLPRVPVPTLLVVPGKDRDLVARNEDAFGSLACASQIAVIGNATRTLCEAGAAHACRYLIRRWCEHHVAPVNHRSPDRLRDGGAGRKVGY